MVLLVQGRILGVTEFAKHHVLQVIGLIIVQFLVVLDPL